jgi:transposase
MAKYKAYDYSQRVMLPVSLEDQLMPGTLEFAIHTLVEDRMDLSVFDSQYNNDGTGRPAYDPKVLLKVVLLGYSRGLISSRKIERACIENVTFMALSCGQHPDHSTIAAFVSSMRREIMFLFRDVLLVCDEMDLLGGTFFALDGVKLPSNASKEWSGTFSDLKKKKDKIEVRVKQLLEEQFQADMEDEGVSNQESSSERLDRDRQIEKLQKKAGRIERWLAENEPKTGSTGKEIKSNVTDNESAKMHTSHGTIQGYNGQALVDNKHQVIVHGEAFGNGQDYNHVEPMVEGAKENMEAIGHDQGYFEEKILTADSNYHSATNLKKCEEERLDAYIPDKDFRTRDARFSTRERYRTKSKKFVLKDFRYDETADRYVCPHGKILKLRVKKTEAHGLIQRRYAADEKDCKDCPLRSKCLNTKSSKRRRLSVPIGFIPSNLSKKMAQKIDTEGGRKIYTQRLAITEPVFANIRSQKRMDRFTLRGKIKVSMQWLLYCMIHNIEKIMNYGFVY